MSEWEALPSGDAWEALPSGAAWSSRDSELDTWEALAPPPPETPSEDPALLLQTGSTLLLQTGSRLLLEDTP